MKDNGMLKNKGFSIVDLAISLFLISIVTTISYKYLTSYMTSIATVKGYVNQEEVSHFIEKFFRKDIQCAKTLQKAEKSSGVTSGDPFTVKELISVQADGTEQPALFFEGLKEQLENQQIDVSFLPLKKNRELAKFDFTVRETDKKTGKLKTKQRTFYTEILRNDDKEIEECLGSAKAVEYCESGTHHILSYDESGLNPITSSEIEKNEPHGTVYKTLTKSKFDASTSVSCFSYSSCEHGEWNNNAYCYNSCTDEVWSSDRNSYDQTDCAGNLQKVGELVECPSKKGFVCDKFVLKMPECSINLEKLCNDNKIKVTLPCFCLKPPCFCPPSYKYKSQQVRKLCDSLGASLKFISPSVNYSIPKGNYGETRAKTMPITDETFTHKTLGYKTIYAQCEYTGKWHIMGVICDEHPYVRLGGQPNNIFGRKKQSGICWAEYPSRYSCDTNKNITLTPNLSHDSQGKIIPSEIKSVENIFTVKDKSKIPNRIAHELPIRFVSDFKGKNSVTYTFACNYDHKNNDFEERSRSKYCFHKNRKGAELDLLFIVDNSGSMKEEQDNLANNLNNFLDRFLSKDRNKNADSHFAVITTDGRFRLSRGFICNYKNCPGKEENDINLIKNRLKSAIKAGTGGSKHERSFRSVTYMKQKYPEFFREQATLALFFLTDEDDRSWEVSETDFINFLFDKHRIKGVSGLNRKSRKNTKIFIAVNDIDSQYKLFPGPECITNGEPEEIRHFMYLFEGASASNPKKYKSPINEVDLCDPNFSKRIQDFGDQLASILQVTDIPIRPTNLNNLDKDNLPSALRDSSGKPNMSCK